MDHGLYNLLMDIYADLGDALLFLPHEWCKKITGTWCYQVVDPTKGPPA